MIKSLMLASPCLVFSLAVLASFSCTLAWGSVDDSKPDLSMFKLAPVNTKQLARSRLGKPIRDLATGAVHMHESLFVEANNVMCPAYAHLFKLIRRQQEQQRKLGQDSGDSMGETDELNLIRQDVVEKLAVLVTYDRILYHDLFLLDAKQVSAEDFIEAIEMLERESARRAHSYETPDPQRDIKRATWLDLVQCLSSYMVGRLAHPRVSQLLRDPARQTVYGALAQFRSIPITEAPVEGELAPEALVRNLANRYEMGIQNRRMFSATEMQKAAEQIGALEDEDTSALKREIMAKLEAEAREAAAAAATRDGELEPQQQQQQQPGAAAAAGDYHEETEIELVVPIVSDSKQTLDGSHMSGHPEEEEKGSLADDGQRSSSSSSSASSAHFHEAQMAILKFIKMRLEQRPTGRYERVPRLSMQLAFDFRSHWDDLQAAKGQLDPSTSLGKHAISFLEDENCVALAGRVSKAIEIYIELTKVLAEMKQHEDQYESMDDLRLPLERLTELLNSLDSSFDVDDIRRLHSIWEAKYIEYSTMDKFINSDSW